MAAIDAKPGNDELTPEDLDRIQLGPEDLDYIERHKQLHDWALDLSVRWRRQWEDTRGRVDNGTFYAVQAALYQAAANGHDPRVLKGVAVLSSRFGRTDIDALLGLWTDGPSGYRHPGRKPS